MKTALLALLLAGTAGASLAATVPEVVPYSGSFDESSIATQDGLPAGDFDTLGGVDQVGLFRLVEGTNTFSGSIFSPSDPADVFLIEILSGFQLVSASLNWATNLPGLQAPDIFNTPPGFLQQNTFNLPAGGVTPSWTLEESDPDPTIFSLTGIEAGMVGSTFDVAPRDYDAPGFTARGPGVYSSIFDAGTSCAQNYVPVFPGVSAQCVDGLDYTLSFVVEATTPPPAPVPLPAGGALLIGGLGLFAALRRRKTSH